MGYEIIFSESKWHSDALKIYTLKFIQAKIEPHFEQVF